MIDEKDLVKVTDMPDSELEAFMKKNGISLKLDEARKIVELIGRNPTLTEMHIFNIEWSEHCSYKSSKNVLKLLPTSGPTVIQGPKEDAGIIHLANIDGERYGVVMAHESHNHPSQVVPYEGAATGIGGIIRDVLCMGAKIIAVADPLRFGNQTGKFKDRTKYIANSVIDGIAGYGNPLGIANLAGDVYMNPSFDDNCLVNVACLGIVKESEIIHSAVPANSEGYDVILIGKATDNSGFGGAAFASLILDEDDKEFNKGAVQVPDPFLKNILVRATYAVFKEVREKKIPIGFKDCGAGGIMCVTSELGASGNMGMDIDLDKVHVSMNIPPYIIACGETQERFAWVVPKSFTPTVLRIYNEDFELPNVAEQARASVIGTVTNGDRFVMRYKGKVVCDTPIKVVTEGIRYNRETKKPDEEFKEPELEEPKNYNHALLDVLSLPQVASKNIAFNHYDKEVMCLTVIRPGEADAGVMAPLPGKKPGIALSVDGNPRYSRINPFLGGVNAVAEAMRNVAAVGAVPYGMTDCLNYGNPEKPEQMWEFVEGVKGISEAANSIWLKGHEKTAVPFVSGNVSFYNESTSGKSVDPSAIIACLGVMEDYSKAITTKIKKQGSHLYMIGPRKDELGGSAYYDSRNELGANVPKIDYAQERGMIYSVIDAINERLVLSCHDISDGGMVVAVAEMILGLDGKNAIGANVLLNDDMGSDKLLFSESSGFIMEINPDNVEKVEKILAKYKIDMFKIGETGGDSLVFTHKDKEIINLGNKQIGDAWLNGFEEGCEMKIAVILFPGVNMENEMVLSCQAVGMDAEIVRWNDTAGLENYDGYILAGGFSYEDRIRAGVISAKDPLMNIIKKQAAEGKPVLGVCNGCQVLIETGIIPGLKDKIQMGMAPNINPKVTGYYNVWVNMKSEEEPGRSAFTSGYDMDEVIPIPVAHGEGRFTTNDKQLLKELQDNGQILFRYCNAGGDVINEFPINPNGAVDNIVGICNKEGNVLAMMPHPERCVWKRQMPYYEGHDFEDMESAAPCRAIFESMRQYIEARK